METLIHEKLSEAIIGAAMKVLNTLKPGLDEKVYENALVIELRKRGHRVDQQKIFTVYYDNQSVGTFIPDLIVDELVIADPKVVTAFTDTHSAKMTGYLAITGLQLALLLNFKFARLGWKRIVRSEPTKPQND
ncbi:MAG: GxxExxY protein [Opitutus sp.]|nr:GxxExxY protein [Opitutus sp.]